MVIPYAYIRIVYVVRVRYTIRIWYISIVIYHARIEDHMRMVGTVRVRDGPYAYGEIMCAVRVRGSNTRMVKPYAYTRIVRTVRVRVKIRVWLRTSIITRQQS